MFFVVDDVDLSLAHTRTHTLSLSLFLSLLSPSPSPSPSLSCLWALSVVTVTKGGDGIRDFLQLFGEGVYFGECIEKADQYTGLPDEGYDAKEPLHQLLYPNGARDHPRDVCYAIVCR